MANKTIKLNSGYECPLLGYGTWQSQDTEQLKTGLRAAIEAGYRHIDTAQAYRNEHIIGEVLDEVIKAGKVKREELFITTKLFSSHFKTSLVLPTLKKQLEALKVDYVDLYLLHFPVPMEKSDDGKALNKMNPDGTAEFDRETKLEDTWLELEKCVEAKLVRSIGVSNFTIPQVERMMKCGKIKPAMNQVESSPVFQNTKLIEFCQKNGVATTGYSSFGSPGTMDPRTGKPYFNLNLLENPTLKAIGDKYKKNNAQVILRWQIQRNVVMIPKSLTPSRIAENFNIWDFELSKEDIEEIQKMDTNKRQMMLPIKNINEHPESPYLQEGSW